MNDPGGLQMAAGHNKIDSSCEGTEQLRLIEKKQEITDNYEQKLETNLDPVCHGTDAGCGNPISEFCRECAYRVL